MAIRAFAPSDLTPVLEIYALSKLDELANEAYVPELVPLDRDPPRFASFKQSSVYVYETTQLLGFAAYSGNEITALFVHPAARGQRIGRTLLEHLLALVPPDCCLHVAASNTAAMALYRQYGFEISAHFQAHYNGVPVAAATMRRTV
ncbi:GNAT family N-acetyltransferase [Rhodoferax sp.]|uniref:GNAT family N-acetyltransferase n=1 Tax=Rhodoferax sp. TaxID=50421 RepID=UPI00374CC7C2